MKNVLPCALFVSVVLVANGASAQPTDASNRDEVAVQQAVDELLRSARYLEWDSFLACFASDATVFYMGKPSRSDGWGGLEAFFRPRFEGPVKTGVPPYLTIEPIDLQVRMVGNGAVVTYLLGDRESDRTFRTLVYEKRAGKWLIIHLHASNPAVAQPNE